MTEYNNKESSSIYFFDDENFVCEGYSSSGWYFWDETDTNLIGPFKTDSNAKIAKYIYGFNINENNKKILS